MDLLVDLNDLAWAIERMEREQVRALIDAQVFGKQPLKGCGDPDKIDRRDVPALIKALRWAISKRRAPRRD